MPVVTTKQNRVVAYEAGENDVFVKVVWHGPGEDGRHLRQFDGPLRPIKCYQEVLDWAVSMADQMRFPLYVVPRTGVEALKSAEMRVRAASLTDRERGELRRFVVSTLAEVMRDCNNHAVRADAFDLLSDMGVITT